MEVRSLTTQRDHFAARVGAFPRHDSRKNLFAIDKQSTNSRSIGVSVCDPIIGADSVFNRAPATLTPIKAVEQVVVPALEQVGAAWEAGSVAMSQVCKSGRFCEELIDRVPPPSDPDRKRQPRSANRRFQLSHGLNVPRTDYLGPLFSFCGDEFSEVNGRAGNRRGAQVEEVRLHRRIGKTRIDRPVELLDNFDGRVPGRTYAGPAAGLVAGHKFSQGRQVRQRIRANRCRNGQRSELARFDVLD